MSSRFTQFILIAMALGIVMGTLVFNYLPDQRVEIAADVNLIAMLFLRLIKMIIAPLVFATLVGGIAHMGSGARLGRIFAKTMGWFVSASFVSLLLGLVMVNLLQPGANFPGTLPAAGQSTGLPVSAFSIENADTGRPVDWPAAGSVPGKFAPGCSRLTMTSPSSRDTNEALTNQPMVFAKMRPSRAPLPIWAMPPTSVANTRGAMIILIRRRNSMAIRLTSAAISTR